MLLLFLVCGQAGYVSGHSTFSRAGAVILDRFTGSPSWPGGLGTQEAPKDHFLEFESGPSETLVLEWNTYYDSADEAGVSFLCVCRCVCVT